MKEGCNVVFPCIPESKSKNNTKGARSVKAGLFILLLNDKLILLLSFNLYPKKILGKKFP